MTAHTTCQNCHQPVHQGTHLCRTCVTQLRKHLTNTANHYTDLDTLRTRQRAIRYDLPKGKGGKREQPLPIDPRFLKPTIENGHHIEGWATVLIAQAHNTTTTWTQTCLHTWPNLTPPHNNIPAACAWLATMTTAIAGQPWAGDMYNDFHTIARRLEHLVDIAPEKRFAGKCWIPLSDNPDDGDCQQELYARPGQTFIICPACGTEHPVEERRKFLLEQVAHMNVTAQEAAEALAAWTDLTDDVPRLRNRIRMWADRGRLEVVGHIEQRGRTRRLYRMADIQERLIEAARHTQERAIG